MRFYDLLQLDPGMIKAQIRAAGSRGEKGRLAAAMVLRSILIVLFATVFISVLTLLFGAENSPMAVALFCILLGVRFVDFHYCIRDSLINLGLAFFLLLVGPTAANLVHPAAAVLIHFTCLFLILLMTTAQPMMGNGGMYGFAYVYLNGNPVTGDAFWRRLALTVLCYGICAAIFYVKHRKKNPQVRFRQITASFRLTDEVSRWQLRMVLGLSAALFLGAVLHVERYMWMCFAVSSLLSAWPMQTNTGKRGLQRFGGVVGGSLLFLLLLQLIPPAWQSLLGPLGGLLVGFCGTYPFKSAMNCLGALMIATPLYGGTEAVLLRICDNGIGILFALLVVVLYRRLVESRFTALQAEARA